MEELNYENKNGYVVFHDIPSPKITGDQLPYGLEGIVLPVLDNPADINRLYKGINRTSEWNSPDIFYLGNYEQCEELEKHFGIKELNSKDHHVQVHPYGGDVADNLEHIYKNKKVFEYVRRWIFDADGIPCFLESKEIMNSVLLPAIVSVTDTRLICGPATVAYYPIIFDGKEYLQVCLHHDTDLSRYRWLCKYKNIERFYLIEHTETLFDDVISEVTVNTAKQILIGKVGYSMDILDDSKCRINIDNSNERIASYQSIVSLSALYQKKKEMVKYVENNESR